VVAIGDAAWLVAGLGNPGPVYAGTRHNVGYAVVERLATDGAVGFTPGAHEAQVALIRVTSAAVLLLKPQTFMNRSGRAVSEWLSQLGLPPARLVVVHDDLDLPVGRLRIVVSAGSGGHRGVRSIQETLGTTEFGRVRIGIGRPEAGTNAADRVLADVPPDERSVLLHAVTNAAGAVRSLIAEGPARAMNRYNVRPRPDSPSETTGADNR
jgi:PTH1 family peptidyl-tRNA hydrolase